MTLAPLGDTHCHLESKRFDHDRDDVIARARAMGVCAMITCGTDERGSQRAVDLAAAHEGVFAAVGVHPHEARTSGLASDNPDARQTAREALTALARQAGVVAIGEIGLDYHYDFSPRPMQRAALAEQLALAAELKLPVILHTRESDAELRAIVDRAPAGLHGVLHCFLSDRAMADWALERGLYLGFGGAVTFRNTQAIQAIAADMPLDRILIETDAPFMAPHPHRGKRNEPAYVGLVAERIGQIRGLDAQTIAQRTYDNAVRLFGLPQHGT